MQPAYYEDFDEIIKKIWIMLDDAVKNRSSQFRIPTFICGNQNDLDGRIVVLRKSKQQERLLQFHSDIRSDKILKLKSNNKAAMFLKLVTTGLPVAAVAAAAGTQALASSEVEIRQTSGLRKNDHYKKYLETARF